MIEIRQYKFSDSIKENFDLLIAASGFESRARFQSSLFTSLPEKKIVLGFNNDIHDSNRLLNDSFFKENKFEQFIVDGDTNDLDFFEQLIKKCFTDSKKEYNIYVDYSCMTRNWYGYLLYISSQLHYDKKINITFGYSHAKYSPAPEIEVLNRVVEPLLGYCNLSIPDKPTALIICLGNEKNRAYGLREYFDATTYLFYSDSSFNNQFSNEVKKINHEILNSISQGNIITFPVHDLIHTNYLLENLCLVLMKSYRIVLAPCGPKPFTLLSFINSLKHNSDLEVWRISPGKGLPKINREANGLVSVLKVTLQA